MIREDVTLEQFGYRPSSLSHASTKKIVFECDFCGLLFDRKQVQMVKLSRQAPHACRKCDQIKSNWRKNNPSLLSPKDYFSQYRPSLGTMKSILWEETRERFGYGEVDIGPRSDKMVVCRCEFCKTRFDTSPATLSRTRGPVACKGCAAIKSKHRPDDGLSPEEAYALIRAMPDMLNVDRAATIEMFGYDPLFIPPRSQRTIMVICWACKRSFQTHMDSYTEFGPDMSCSQQCGSRKAIRTIREKYGVGSRAEIPGVSEKLSNPKTEQIVEAVLRDYYKVDYIRGWAVGPYSFDFYIPSADLLIECQGDFFHDFKTSGYSGTPKDRAKSTYAANHSKSRQVWLWEHEIHFGRVKKVLDFHFGMATMSPISPRLEELTFSTVPSLDAHRFLSLHHYIGNLGVVASPMAALFAGEIICLAVFGGVTRNGSLKRTSDQVGTRMGSKNLKELRRLCVRPNVSTKNLISYCMRRFLVMLKDGFPEVMGVISFSDPGVLDSGTVYKACNFLSLGDSAKSYHYMDGGRPIHKRTAYESAISSKMTESEFVSAAGLVRVNEVPKHKWIYLYDR